MSVKIAKGQALSHINLTPMIDCVFLLLIFFLVATRFEEAEREMSVALPDASTAMPLTVRPRALFVNVDQQGRYVVDQQVLDDEGLLAALRAAAAANPGQQTVKIFADRRCPWQFVMNVMNACNKAGIRNYTCAATGESE